MFLEELKVGDKIKFFWKNGDYKSYTGEIKKLQSNWFYIETLDGLLCDWVYKDNIVSKLEPQYKEIKIEQNSLFDLHPYICPLCRVSHGLTGIYNPQEIKYCPQCIKNWPEKCFIKSGDLKIGDIIKFKTPNSSIAQGTINKIYSDSFIVDGNHVSEKYVISKIEKILDPMTSSKIPVSYIEIPIEKEEQKWQLTCKTCGHKEPIKKYEYIYNYVCEECINKEKMLKKQYDEDFNKIKPAPKSFKYNFYVTSISETSDCDYGIRGLAAEGDAIVINSHQQIKSLPIPDWVELGKTYTIEIKEKE